MVAVVFWPALPSPKMVKVKLSLPLKPGFDRYVTPAAPADAEPFFGGDVTLTDLMTVFPPVRSAVAAQGTPLTAARVPTVAWLKVKENRALHACAPVQQIRKRKKPELVVT